MKISKYTVDSIFNNHVNALLNEPSFSRPLSHVFGLYYVFEYPDGYEDISLLGLFSSKATSQKAKELLILDARFKKISKHIKSFKTSINTPQWTEGFIQCSQALEETKQNKDL